MKFFEKSGQFFLKIRTPKNPYKKFRKKSGYIQFFLEKSGQLLKNQDCPPKSKQMDTLPPYHPCQKEGMVGLK